MVRTYKKVVGGRSYQNYCSENLEKALHAISSGKVSIRKAAEQYNVPKSTISDKLRNKHTGQHGGQKCLTDEEERNLALGLGKCAEWGFPFKLSDVQLTVQGYLNRIGRVEKRFRNNCPGTEWCKLFLKRHPELSQRFGENIKRVRAAVDHKLLNNYFSNLEEVLQGVPPSNIVNYDETNFTDDPGKSKVVVKRGCKHPEVIKDTSKASTSVMFAAAADGSILPPYVVYKASYIYPTWIENGPEGARFNSTKSGWFDMAVFEDWFFSLCVPHLSRLQGRKVLIGDNLSSHVSQHVIQKCEELDIQFVLLPPNSTHLTQPLDIAFFRPLKRSWRKCLDEWKKKNRGCLPKSEFPKILKRTLDEIQISSKQNIFSGFRAAGIVPCDRQQVLKRVPNLKPAEEASDEQDKSWTDTFVEMLSEARASPASRPHGRGKRVNIAPGKSVGLKDLAQQSSRTEDISESSSSSSEDSSDANDSDDTKCLVCNKLWSHSKPGNDWVQCDICKEWAHEKCAGFPRKIYNCCNCKKSV